MRIAAWTGSTLALVLALVLGGCGSSGTSAPAGTSASAGAQVSTELAGTPGAPSSSSSTKRSPATDATAVAHVEDTAIAKPTYDHWLAVTTALSGSRPSTASASLKDHTLSFLITAEWLLGEAAAQKVQVSEADIHKHLAEVQKQQFKHPGELTKYLARAHETNADLLLRVKLELLESAISKRITAGKRTTAEKRSALTAFEAQFASRWKGRTSCARGYVMEDCKEYKVK